MFTRLTRLFSTNKTYGNLKDADRIFTNVYKDSDPYNSGALRRVTISISREIGIVLKISLPTESTGSSIKSNCQGLEVEEEQVSLQDSSILSCPKSPLLKDLAI